MVSAQLTWFSGLSAPHDYVVIKEMLCDHSPVAVIPLEFIENGVRICFLNPVDFFNRNT